MARPIPAGEVLADLFNRLEYRERLREYAVFRVWDDVVGPVLAGKTEPARIERGRLFVRVEDSGWMQELHFLKGEIRRRLNRRLGSEIVREVFLVLGSRLRERPPEPEPIPDHPVDESRIAALVPETGHAEIEAALRRVARSWARRFG